MNDLISRQAAIESIRECAEAAHSMHDWDMEQGYLNAIECIEEEPSAQPERKRGKWLEMHCYEYKAQELQTCKCSVCGRYDTRPYLYYFSKPNFCSWCGADMKGEAAINGGSGT